VGKLTEVTVAVLYFVRHGEVHNPNGIAYGSLPGYGLSLIGRKQVKLAAQVLMGLGPFSALYASPLQRTQESAAILSEQLRLTVQTDDLLVETSLGSYQGRPFAELPKPLITESDSWEGVESAGSIRARILAWAKTGSSESSGSVVAISHRDPIAVALLHWQGKGIEDLPTFDLPTGGVYEVRLEQGEAQVKNLSAM
jgi:broad specificity phosphatase PhoE